MQQIYYVEIENDKLLLRAFAYEFVTILFEFENR